MQAVFSNWVVEMIGIHARYLRDQAIVLAKITWCDLQIAWCDLKIAFHS